MKKCVLVLAILALLSKNSKGQNTNWFCSTDSALSCDLIFSSSWKNLPASYKIIRHDTLCNSTKFNARILYNSKLVAIGTINKNNIPHGVWFIEPANTTSVCWGKIKNGYKKGTWWCKDGFYIKFTKKGNILKGHTLP